MDKKYKLTDETIIYCDRKLRRIEALRNFNDVVIGQKGGFIESEGNLSHEGNCWIYNNAKVFDDACVYGNARIYYIAEVYDSAEVYDNAIVCYKAKIFGYAEVCDNALIGNYAEIYDDALICGYANIRGNAKIYEKAIVSDNAVISGNSKIHGKVEVTGNTYIIDAEISKMDDYIVFKNWWSSGRYFTWTKSNNMWSVGCFYGTGEELIAKAYWDSELSGREYERIVKYVEAINKPVEKLNLIQRIICKVFRINYE